MKVSYYELLGMIKDGNTPKQIKWNNKIYKFDDNYENEVDFFFINDYIINGIEYNFFKKDIEIIEEEQNEKLEKQKKEVIDYIKNHKIFGMRSGKTLYADCLNTILEMLGGIKKMKVIDVLKEVYNGTLPDRFKFDFENDLLTPCIYIKRENRIRHNSFYDVSFTIDDLEKDIEIIEEESKQIKNIYIEYSDILSKDIGISKHATHKCICELQYKINELVDAVNELKAKE